MASRVRYSRAGFAGFVLIATLLFVPQVTRGAANDGIRLVSATEGRIVFEIDLSGYTLTPSSRLEGTERLEIEGFGGFSDPGRPWVPGRSYLVGVPPSGEPTVSWSAVKTVPLGSHVLEPVAFPLVFEDENGEPFASEEYRIDPAVYGGGATAIGVFADPVLKLRRQRVLPLRVVPVAYDPATGETTIATLVRVEVSFPSERGPARSNGAGEPVSVPDAPVWERLYERVLVNPSQAAKWRVREAPRVRDVLDPGASSDALSGPLVKLLVRDTGLHRVSASSVIGKGFPSGTAISSLKVFKRTYDPESVSEGALDVAFRVVEDPAGTSGVFDGNDWIVFFGKRLREDDLQGDPLEKFSYENVYWLGTSGGLEMPSQAVLPGVRERRHRVGGFPGDGIPRGGQHLLRRDAAGREGVLLLEGSLRAPILGAVHGAIDRPGRVVRSQGQVSRSESDQGSRGRAFDPKQQWHDPARRRSGDGEERRRLHFPDAPGKRGR